MAKKAVTSKQVPKSGSDFSEIIGIIDKYFWIFIPLLTIIYYFSSRYSQGFYQDDEIGQYLNMIKFWSEPSAILGNNPKPGYKIFMVVPSLFGYQGVILFNSFIAALTVFFTHRLIKVYGINYAFLGALLLAVQPLFFDLSFRSYSEIFTSLCIIFLLITYKKEQYLLSALICGYIFTVRQEIAVFCIILAVIFFRKKLYKEIIVIGLFPVLYNLLGYFKTGDIFFVLTEMKSVAALAYNTQGVFHYFKVYIFIVGPVTLALFLFGFFGFFAETKNYKNYLKKYGLFYSIFITVFLVQIYTMWNNGPNPGNWRYLLHISPVCAFFAVVGFNNLALKNYRNKFFIITGSLAFLTLIFLSKVSDGFKLTEEQDYTKLIFLVLLMILAVLVSSKDTFRYLNTLSLLYAVLAIAYLSVDFKPKELSPENITVKKAVEYISGLNKKDIEIYSNHSFVSFFSEDYRKNAGKFKSINSKNIPEIREGSLVVWDTHYGYRPEWGSDVKLETIQQNQNFKLLNQVTSADRRFTVYIFEKVN